MKFDARRIVEGFQAVNPYLFNSQSSRTILWVLQLPFVSQSKCKSKDSIDNLQPAINQLEHFLMMKDAHPQIVVAIKIGMTSLKLMTIPHMLPPIDQEVMNCSSISPMPHDTTQCRNMQQYKLGFQCRNSVY